MDVRLPDGRIVKNVPEGTTRAQLMAKLGEAPVQKPPAARPAGPPPSGASRFLTGVLDPIRAGTQALYHVLPESVVSAVDTAGNKLADLGLPIQRNEGGAASYDESLRAAEADYQARRGGQAGVDWMRMGGNVAATLPAALAIPAGATLGARVGLGAATGAGVGAAQPVLGEGDYGKQKLTQAMTGAVTGAVFPLATSAAARVVKPSTDRAAKALMQQGVRLTPGQVLGGAWRKAEEGLRSVPLVGDAIASSERKAMEDFNRVAINRALAPIGGSVGKGPVGREGVSRAHAVVSRAYDRLLPRLGVASDGQFGAELSNLSRMATNLPPDRATQFNAIVQNEVLGRMTGAGRASGETAKQIDSALGRLARAYQKSEVGDERLLGNGLRELQASFRRLLERSNPQYAGRLSRLNEAYANLLRVENAASRQGAKEGVFTPAQLSMATRALDSSLRKRQSAHGGALMQDLSDAGQKVLGSRLPDSGTANRLLLFGMLGGGYALNPAIPAAQVGAAGLYTEPAQKVIRALLAKRPAGAGTAAAVVRRLDRPLTAAAVPSLQKD